MLEGIAAIIWDFDGVLNKATPKTAKGPSWTKKLMPALGIDPEHFKSAVFNHDFRTRVICGELDFLEHLRNTNEGFFPKGGERELAEFWFSASIDIDEDVLDLCESLAADGFTPHLGTNNEPMRTRQMWEVAGLKEKMESCFSSGLMGIAKPHPEFFETIEKQLAVPAAALLLIDDDETNVKGARACGWNAHAFRDIDRLRSALGL